MVFFHRSIQGLFLAAGLLLSAPGHVAEPNPKSVSYTLPAKLAWIKGVNSDVVTVQGDPSKPGIYIQLLRWHPHNMSRPHSHSTERYITVLSGTWWIGTGSKYDPASTFPAPAGSYVVDHANELHYDGAKDTECVLEIVGMGPVLTTSAESK